MVPLYKLSKLYLVLQLLFPFMGGITIAHLTKKDPSCLFLTFIMLFVIIVITALFSKKLSTKIYEAFIRSWVFFLFLFLGFIFEKLEPTSPLINWSNEKATYEAVVMTPPKSYAHTIQLQLCIVKSYAQASHIHKMLMATIYRDSNSIKLKSGDAILFKSFIKQPKNKGNPGEFNYAQYLKDEGIRGTTFLISNDWKRLNSSQENHLKKELPWDKQLRIEGRRLRCKLTNRYKQYFKGDPLAILSALTLGDKHLLRKETKTLFSETGGSHVLALSGLHLGIIVSILLLIFHYNNSRRSLKIGRIITLFFIFAFTYIVGFPISLLRAALMYSLCIILTFTERNSEAFNNLCASALILLIINPNTLFSVSFQLSFCAVGTILLLMPYIENFASNFPKSMQWFINFIGVTICAQLGSAPLIAYYFHYFPLYFIATSMIVIPFTYLLIIGSIIFYTLPIVYLQTLISQGLIFLITTMLYLLQSIAELPHSILPLYPCIWSVGLCYTLLLLLLSYRKNWIKKLFLTILTALLVLIVEELEATVNRINPQIIFYNEYQDNVVQYVISNKRSYLWGGNETVNHYISKSYWEKNNFDPPINIDTTFVDDKIKSKNGLICFSGKTIVIIHNNHWKKLKNNHILKVDYLVISEEYKGNLHDIITLFQPKTLIFENSLKYYHREKLEKEAKHLSLNYYDLEEQGALVIPIK